MTQTFCFKKKRDLISQWLWDTLEKPDSKVSYGHYWADAADVIKFIRANGIELVCTSSYQGAARLQEDILYHAQS